MRTRRAGAWMAIGVAGLVAGLAGCAQVKNAVNDVNAAFDTSKDQPEPPPATSYCYRTLGKVDCYSQPLPASEANRLIGHQGPPPRSTSATGPLSP